MTSSGCAPLTSWWMPHLTHGKDRHPEASPLSRIVSGVVASADAAATLVAISRAPDRLRLPDDARLDRQGRRPHATYPGRVRRAGGLAGACDLVSSTQRSGACRRLPDGITRSPGAPRSRRAAGAATPSATPSAGGDPGASLRARLRPAAAPRAARPGRLGRGVRRRATAPAARLAASHARRPRVERRVPASGRTGCDARTGRVLHDVCHRLDPRNDVVVRVAPLGDMQSRVCLQRSSRSQEGPFAKAGL